MLPLLARIRRTILEQRLIERGDRVIVAVSGGADSTALAHLLKRASTELGASLVGLAHLNHELRPSADEDERFCHRLAETLEVPIIAGRADIRRAAQRQRTSIEDAARFVRYTFLRDAAGRLGANRIAAGHTKNDQAETVLLRLFRGGGPVGLAGIYPRVGALVRPLLDVSRTEVERFLREEGFSWQEDPTNRDVTIPRNWVRHELLPRLAEHAGEGIVDVLARQAALFREDAEHLEAQATEIARRLVLTSDGHLEIDVRELAAVPPALRGRLVLGALRAAANGRFIGFAQVEAVLGLIDQDGRALGAVDMPGQRVEIEGDRLVFRPSQPDPGRAGRRRGRPARQLKGPGADFSSEGNENSLGGATVEGHAPKGGRG